MHSVYTMCVCVFELVSVCVNVGLWSLHVQYQNCPINNKFYNKIYICQQKCIDINVS